MAAVQQLLLLLLLLLLQLTDTSFSGRASASGPPATSTRPQQPRVVLGLPGQRGLSGWHRRLRVLVRPATFTTPGEDGVQRTLSRPLFREVGQSHGSVFDTPATVAPFACHSCPARYWSPPNRSNCQPCPPGTASGSPVATARTRSSAPAEASACAACLGGTYA